MKKISIYTDGACSGNPGKGGWGAVLLYKNFKKEIYGGQKDATNNQMELRAIIEALNTLKEPCEVDLYTDSEYVLKGFTERMQNWIQNDWKTSDKKPVKNKEYWIKLTDAAAPHKVNWNWVRGHSGNEYNEVADGLARKGVEG
jgi:ribonuclease HI